MENELIKILYIDDEKAALFNFEQLFYDDFDVYTAISVAKGLEILASTDIQIVISDQRMPDKTGIEFFAEVAQLYPHTVRILLTAYSEAAEIIDAINRGQVYQYITKPFETRNVKNILDKASQSWRLKKENEVLIAQLQNKNEEYEAINEELRQVNEELSAANIKTAESQNRLNEAQKLAHIGVWDWDTKTDTVIWSDELYQIAGRDPKLPAPSYAEHSEIYTPQSWHSIKTAVENSMKTGELYQLELDLICTDGSIRNVNAFGGVKYNASKQIIGIFGTLQDITERKRAEETLRIKNEELDRYFSLSLDLLCIANTDGYFIRLNPAWEIVLGYSIAELQGRSFLELVHPDDIANTLAALSDLSDKKPVLQFENRYCCKDGSYRCIEWQSQPYGELIYAVARDITERKHAEEALRESENRFRALFEKGPIGVAYHEMVYDDSGKAIDYRFLDANSSYIELTGVDPRGKLVTQAFPGIENDPFDWIGTFGHVASTGEQIRFEQYLQTNNRWYDCVGYQFKQDHFVAAFMEITERKQAEELLKKSEERFRKLFNEAPLGMVVIDSLTGEINDLNPMFAKIAGRTMAEMKDINWMSITHPDDIQADLDNMDRMNAGKTKGFTMEKRYLHKDGSPVWINLTVAPLNVEDKTHPRHLCMIEDITERKQSKELMIANKELVFQSEEKEKRAAELIIANKELAFQNEEKEKRAAELLIANKELLFQSEEKEKRAAELIIANNELAYQNEEKEKRAAELLIANKELVFQSEEKEKRAAELIIANNELAFQNEEKGRRASELVVANKELESFSYSVSHDLRAPLRHIDGYVELLISRYYDMLPDKARHYLDNIADSSRQMGTLIDDLLQFSRTGRQALRLAHVDMNGIVAFVLEQIQHDVPDRNIEWNIAQLPFVLADEALLRLVWTNLLSNAVKFTRNCEKAIIEIDVLDENNTFTFSVRDNGVGFDMQYAQNLFGVFQRLHPNDQFEGTGIGLANVHQIIIKHGGRTWAESVPNKGATFFFSLPK